MTAEELCTSWISPPAPISLSTSPVCSSAVRRCHQTAPVVVAEGYPLLITNSGSIADTTVGRSGDLYLLDAP